MRDLMNGVGRRAGHALGLAGAVLLLMGVNDDNGCAPGSGGETQCEAASDCTGVPHVDCVGAWTCGNGECVWECGDPGPVGCYGDQDCPGDLECNAAEVCLSPPGCQPGEPCPAVCYGHCVAPDPEPTPLCTSSNDCQSGFHCSTEDGACLSPPGCNVPGTACPAVCYGECVPDEPRGCWSDDDCGAGASCDRSNGCPQPSADADGAPADDRIACPGVCRPDDDATCRYNGVGYAPGDTFPAEDGCNTCTCTDNGMIACTLMACQPSCDVVRCPEGTVCEERCDCGQSNTDPACVCTVECVPTGGTCADGTQCPPGQTCQEECYTVCADCAADDPDCQGGCWDECRSQCVETDPPDQCWSDDQCDDGEYCDFSDNCGWGMENGLIACPGQCKPREEEPQYCHQDSQCDEGEFCDFSQGCGGMGNALIACPGVCAPREEEPQYCHQDSECDDGEFCDFSQGCGGMSNGLIACPGVCAPRNNYECSYDSDCPDGERCKLVVCAAEDQAMPCRDENGDGQCDPYYPEPSCWGYCEPANTYDCYYGGQGYHAGESFPAADGCNTCFCSEGGAIACTEMACPTYDCTSNSDCPSGVCDFFMCETASADFAACDPNDASCEERPAPGQCYGWCSDQPIFCGDGTECPAGFHCGCANNWGTPGADGAEDPSGVPCYPQCVPDEPAQCRVDGDCREGQHCATDDCVSNCAPCDPSDQTCPPCTTECWGVCKDDPAPPPYPACDDDGTCPAGSTCECLPNPNCPACDVCWFGCVPDEPEGCREDADCADNEYCEPVPCDQFAPCTAEGCPGCGGVCKERQQPNPCMRTGCSGQVCADEPVFTTCEWRPEYACYDYARCAPGADGECAWQTNDVFDECIERAGNSFE